MNLKRAGAIAILGVVAAGLSGCIPVPDSGPSEEEIRAQQCEEILDAFQPMMNTMDNASAATTRTGMREYIKIAQEHLAEIEKLEYDGELGEKLDAVVVASADTLKGMEGALNGGGGVMERAQARLSDAAYDLDWFCGYE